VILKLVYLGVVGIHYVLLDVAGLVDLVDDDLGVAVGDESLDSKGNNDAQPMVRASYSTSLLDAL
jgi:hypothetical protein